jgi:predicted MFS family arabinose efflux permease
VRLAILLGFAPGAAVGIGRFAYALLLPEMKASLELSYTQSGYLGSANTAGYLAGALLSHRLLVTIGYRRGVFASLILQAATLALMSLALPFEALLALRFAQGVLGAFVFVGGAALLLASGGRSTGMGLYFGGVGVGIILSPIIFPLSETWRDGWLLLSILSLAMTVLALFALPGLREPPPPAEGRSGSLRPVAGLLVAYLLYGAGYIGYMTFVTSGLADSMARFWYVLGIGATLTALVWGWLIERLGGATALRLILALLALSSLHPLVIALPYLSAFLFGISFLAVVTAITTSFRTRLPAAAWAKAMGISTAAFALGQAVGPGVSGLFGDHFGGAQGSLGVATALLGSALLVAWLFPGSDRSSRESRATSD